MAAFCVMVLQLLLCNVLAVLRISGALEASTAVMSSMQQLLKIEDVSATMRELSQEMTKVSYNMKLGVMLT